MGTAHGAEVCCFRAFLRKRFVVELARGFGIEREIELIFPAKLTRLLPQTLPATLADLTVYVARFPAAPFKPCLADQAFA